MMVSTSVDLVPRDTVVAGYVRLMERYNWQWFCTLTFKHPPHPEAAEKKFRLFINKINRIIYGNNWRRKGKGVYWCLALEYHKSGVIHFHALLGDVNPLYDSIKRLQAVSIWNDIGGICKIDAITDIDFAVLNYVAKYTSKGGELDFSDHLQDTPFQFRALAHIQ